MAHGVMVSSTHRATMGPEVADYLRGTEIASAAAVYVTAMTFSTAAPP